MQILLTIVIYLAWVALYVLSTSYLAIHYGYSMALVAAFVVAAINIGVNMGDWEKDG